MYTWYKYGETCVFFFFSFCVICRTPTRFLCLSSGPPAPPTAQTVVVVFIHAVQNPGRPPLALTGAAHLRGGKKVDFDTHTPTS